MIIGIDPGINGGIAILDGALVQLFEMPVFETKIRGKVQRHIDTRGVRKILWNHRGARLFLEEIHSIFGTNASSNFKMGQNLGMLQGLLDMLWDNYELVAPKIWQAEVWEESDKIKKPNGRVETKKTSANAAVRILGSEKLFIPPGKRSLHDGLVDAYLIAKFGEGHE